MYDHVKKTGKAPKTAEILCRDEDGRPIVAAIRDGDLLRFRCPFCRRPHGHGIGDTESFGMADGHRVPHCLYPRKPEVEKGYVIREVADPFLAGSLPRRRPWIERKKDWLK